MKNTFKLTVIAAIVAITAGCVQQVDNENTGSATSEEITSNPVTLYIADDIITMSESAAENITAIAVQNGTILDLGESAELLERYAEHPNLLVDKQFEHNVITPGFVEPHIHLWLSGILMSTDFITLATGNCHGGM